MLVHTFPAGPLGCNCSIVIDPKSKTAVVIDPGGDLPAIRAAVEAAGAKVTSILHTHTHVDHLGATADLQEWALAPARIHEADRSLYEMLPIQAALLGIPMPTPAEIDGDLKDGSTVAVGGSEIAVLHTPGHTPGSVSFLVKTAEGPVAFTGDTLFRRSVGRTDLWGGNPGALVQSVQKKLYSLDEATRVVPGHGPATTIGEERRKNPFVKAG